MPKQLTEYNLLFSCPGDAYSTCFTAIEESVAHFNSYAKASLGLSVNLTHWSKDSYPQSGGHPQALLNSQIVDNADAAIAVFWTRFGTPTDEFGSGTEEEIERLLSDKKQVFLYFLDKAIPPSMTDAPEYRKQRDQILLFRDKYEEKGIFCVVSDEVELKEQFSRHLFLYFANQIAANVETLIDNCKSALVVTAVDGTTDTRVQFLKLLDDMGLESQRCTIVEMIEDVKKVVILPSDSLTASEEVDTASNQIYGGLFSGKNARIGENERQVVSNFCMENKIALDDEFWHLGDLRINTNRISLPFAGSFGPDLLGSDDEKRKFKLIKDVIHESCVYYFNRSYYTKMDSLPYSELIIKNDGKAFDEDIEIKLYLPSGSLLLADEFPVPDFDIAKINEEGFLNKWICPVATADISEFDVSTVDYIAKTFTPQMPILPFQTRDYEAEYETEKEIYFNRLIDIFSWKVFKTKESDIVKIKINKLVQYKAMHFPARIFFKSVPEKITYTITAKHTPKIIEGEINVRH